MPEDTNPYESAAGGPVTLDGLSRPLWWCLRCERVYPGNEHSARVCCATSWPCACGARAVSRATGSLCAACYHARREADDAARWGKAPKVAPGFPCLIWGDDTYFFHESDLDDHMENEGLTTLRMELAEPRSLPHFEMQEFLCAHYLEDDYPDDSYDVAINALIAAAATEVWEGSGKVFEYRYTPEASDEH